MPEKGTMTRVCEYCGGPLSRRARPESRFCSRSCTGKGRDCYWIPSVRERLMTGTETTERGCIVRVRNTDRYTYLKVNRKGRRAHCVSWEIANGRPIPAGMVVMHTCDNPPCINPDHLVLGTNQDNMADASMKGRMAHGSRNPQSKLSPDAVTEIHRRYAAGDVSYSALATEYNVTKGAIAHIIQGRSWRRIE